MEKVRRGKVFFSQRQTCKIARERLRLRHVFEKWRRRNQRRNWRRWRRMMSNDLFESFEKRQDRTETENPFYRELTWEKKKKIIWNYVLKPFIFSHLLIIITVQNDSNELVFWRAWASISLLRIGNVRGERWKGLFSEWWKGNEENDWKKIYIVQPSPLEREIRTRVEGQRNRDSQWSQERQAKFFCRMMEEWRSF